MVSGGMNPLSRESRLISMLRLTVILSAKPGDSGISAASGVAASAAGASAADGVV
jgi:hypothetical protein